MAKPNFKLKATDVVVTAYAQPAAGPGWANRPVWVVIKDSIDGKLREECLQPDEQGADVLKLYNIAGVVHGEFVAAVEAQLRPVKATGKQK